MKMNLILAVVFGVLASNPLSAEAADIDTGAETAARTTFVDNFQAVLNILIGKAGLLNDLPIVGPPIAQLLRTTQSLIDDIFYAAINCQVQFTSDPLVDVAVSLNSQNLQATANSITILSGPLFLIGQGPFPQIVTGFSQINSELQDLLNFHPERTPYTPCNSQGQIQADLDNLDSKLGAAITAYTTPL